MGFSRYNILLQSAFYVFAGANHFINADFYYPLIPDYLPFPVLINYVAGLAEMGLGLGINFQRTRNVSATLLVWMLILFIPAHVYFIQQGSCIADGLCVPEWLSWVRLMVIHPFLVWWALSIRKK